MKEEKKSRRAFIKESGILAVLAGTGALAGCSPDENEPSKESATKAKDVASATKKSPADMTPEEIKAARSEFNKTYHAKFQDSYTSKGDGKWKVHMLGTTAGGLASEGHLFTSWILEKPNGDLLMFDSGEGSSATATFMNLNVLRVKDIFISHPHSDHVGGLGGFIHTRWAMARALRVKDATNFTVHISGEKPVLAAQAFVTNGGKVNGIKIKLIENGEIYNDGEVSVEAQGNLHMPKTKDGKYVSYSFRIKILTDPKKTIIFTGDIKDMDEIAQFLNDGCDLLMFENGHHTPDKICKNLQEKYAGKVKELMIMHLGSHMKHNAEFEVPLAEKYWGKPFIVAHDKQTIVL